MNKNNSYKSQTTANRSLRILLSNDDGIEADGLKSLEKIAASLSDDVWIVAPETEQSGAGHSLTLHTPVRVRKISAKRYAVSGTPTDCVLLAVKQILPSRQKFDLLLSGVNKGSNVGDDVTYSGTIAAAMEGSILGLPSIALSLACDDQELPHWKAAENKAPEIIKKLLLRSWPKDRLININFPNCAERMIKGIKPCAQGKRKVNVQLSERVDPKGRPYYWLGGERDDTPEIPDVDVDFLRQKFITITPIAMDMTDYKTLADFDNGIL